MLGLYAELYRDRRGASAEAYALIEDKKDKLYPRTFAYRCRGTDGAALCVSVGGVVKPGDCQTLRGAGMPTAGGGRGDLHVIFEVVYPSSLSVIQKELLKAAFFLPEKATPAQTAAVDAFLGAFADYNAGWAGGFKM